MFQVSVRKCVYVCSIIIKMANDLLVLSLVFFSFYRWCWVMLSMKKNTTHQHHQHHRRHHGRCPLSKWYQNKTINNDQLVQISSTRNRLIFRLKQGIPGKNFFLFMFHKCLVDWVNNTNYQPDDKKNLYSSLRGCFIWLFAKTLNHNNHHQNKNNHGKKQQESGSCLNDFDDLSLIVPGISWCQTKFNSNIDQISSKVFNF